MKKSNVLEHEGQEQIVDPLTEILREGAKRLIHRAVDEELREQLSGYSGYKTEDGRAAVVRNGHHPEREIQTGVGPVTVRIPKIRSKTGRPVTFRSALVHSLCKKNENTGSGIAMAIFKGDINRGDERSLEGAGWAKGSGTVGLGGIETETEVGKRIYGLV